MVAGEEAVPVGVDDISIPHGQAIQRKRVWKPLLKVEKAKEGRGEEIGGAGAPGEI